MSVAAEILEPRQVTDLIPVEQVNAVELFTGGGLDPLLKLIEQEVTGLPADIGTEKGRKALASVAYKVARSKTVIDDAGKDLVAQWKKQAAAVDAGRRKARDFLDALRDRVRRPLTEWEEEQARIVEAKRKAAELDALHETALTENELFDARATLRRQAEERERQEAAERERIRKEQEAIERKAREERIATEAAEQATRKAEQEIQAAKEREAAAERRAQEAREQADRERIAAEQRAARQAEEAANRERQRMADEEDRQRREAEARAADLNNRTRINAAIAEAFIAGGINDEQIVGSIIRLIASGAIPHVQIRY